MLTLVTLQSQEVFCTGSKFTALLDRRFILSVLLIQVLLESQFICSLLLHHTPFKNFSGHHWLLYYHVCAEVGAFESVLNTTVSLLKIFD